MLAGGVRDDLRAVLGGGVMVGLTAANANAWYVLMTLYGEQKGEEVDEDLHARNRAAWNAWSCQGMTAAEEDFSDVATMSQTAREFPNWPEVRFDVEKRHQAEMLRRNEAHFTYPGFPDVNATIDFHGVLFQNLVEMTDAIFTRNVLFSGSDFGRMACFNRADFRSAAGFLGVTFNSDARFGGATFHREVIFTNATFKGFASFPNTTFFEAWLDAASFRSEVWFDEAVFISSAWFMGTNFSRTVRYDRATFENGVWLGAIYQNDASFNHAKFRGEIWFNNATFGGRTTFLAAEFGMVGMKWATYFIDCKFDKPTDFREAVFLSRYPDFAGAELHDQTTFSAEDKYWPQGGQADPEQARASCGVIRHNLGRQGLPEAEHFFFRREMGFATQIGRWWTKLPYQGFEVFSGFGNSLMIPSGWLGLFWALGFACYWHYLATQTGQGLALAMGTAAAFSFSNLFQIFGFGRLHFDTTVMKDLPTVLKVYAGVQTVAALPLLFFLGLGLRQRFRLR